MSDQAWIRRAEELVHRVLGVTGESERGWVDRWPETMAVVNTEHRQRVDAVERGLARRGILLAGGAFHGPGVDGAVASGEAGALALSAFQRAS